MSAKSQSSNVLLILILVITFPIWFSACAVLFGVLLGLFGATIGVVAGLAGAGIALIFLPFKLIFGGGHWGLIIVLIIVAVLISNRK